MGLQQSQIVRYDRAWAAIKPKLPNKQLRCFLRFAIAVAMLRIGAKNVWQTLFAGIAIVVGMLARRERDAALSRTRGSSLGNWYAGGNGPKFRYRQP